MSRPIRITNSPIRGSIILSRCGLVLSSFNDDEGICNLQTERLVAEPQEDGIVHVNARAESLFSPDRPRPNRGLFLALSFHLHRQGIPFEQRPPTTATALLPEPAAISTNRRRPVSRHVVDFVHDNTLGLILYGHGVGRAAIIEELVGSYPDQTFAVMTSTRRKGADLLRKLRQAGVQAHRTTSRSERRVIIGTYFSMANDYIGLEHRDVIIAHDAREAIGERAQLALTAPDIRGRLYGLLNSDEKLSQLEEDRLAATFGFDHVSVPAYGCQPVSVGVTLFRYDGPFLEADKSLASLKRRGIWNEPRRNQRFTKLARAISEGDAETIGRLAPDLTENHGVNSPRGTVLLADSIEHVVALARRLRSWPIRINPHYTDVGLPDGARRLLQRGMHRWVGRNLIATPDGLSEITPGTFDFLVWAGGGPTLPPIPWNHLTCPSTEPRRLIVVDVDERHHPRLRRWSRQRRQGFRDAGWFERPFNPTLGRVLRFLDRRPQEETA